METASLVSDWTALFITTLGLMGIIAQASSIRDSIDPFRDSRTRSYLGPWITAQPQKPWYQFSWRAPVGPHLFGNREEGFCGLEVVYLSRGPVADHGRASWSVFLASFHGVSEHLPRRLPQRPSIFTTDKKAGSELPLSEQRLQRAYWKDIPLIDMVKHGHEACIPIHRKVLIVCFVLASARQIWRYAGSSGYRAAFASYNGLYNVDIPLGGKALVSFSPHDSHTAGRDAHPPFFERRVSKCIDMLAGVVVNELTGFAVAFPGRGEPDA
jgi:hypothetical protein